MMDLGEKKGGSKMINKTTIKVPKKYEHMVDCISLGLRHKSGSSYYVYVSQGYAGIDSISGRMVTFAILFGQKKAMKFIRSIGPVEEGSETCEAESAEAVVEAPSPECAAAMETAVPSDAPQAPVDTQAEAAVVDGGERLGRASFVVVFSNGERLEFYQPCTWTSISRLVKWRLQMEDELSVARVYAGPVADDVYYVRTYAGGRSVADFHKRARIRAHTGGPSPPAMIDCPEPPAGNRLSLPEVLRDLSPYAVAYWEHMRLLFLYLLLTLPSFDRSKCPIPDGGAGGKAPRLADRAVQCDGCRKF